MPRRNNPRGGAQRPERARADQEPHVPNGIGDLRRSTAASTFGPGAVADFRTDKGAAVSVVTAGLDEWIRAWESLESVHDPRLQKILGVDGFKLPPVVRDRKTEGAKAIPGVRFPRWLQCPQCDVIKIAKEWSNEIGGAERWCPSCTGARSAKHRVFVVPVRFVRACEAGHLDDFPWELWVEHTPECKSRGPLKLRSIGAGIAGVRVFCEDCKASRGMDKAFGLEWPCSGWRPWLAEPAELCTSQLRTVQRGASNLYFPVTRSSLLIPPWDDNLEQRLGDKWADLLETDIDERAAVLRKWLEKGRIDIPSDWDRDAFIVEAVARARQHEGLVVSDLREEEWTRFMNPAATGDVPTSDFEYRAERVAAEVNQHIVASGRVVRLRELRALVGFTRIIPPPSAEDLGKAKVARLSANPKNWFPAVEVRGEGIFLAFQPEKLNAWASEKGVAARGRALDDAFQGEFADRFGEDAVPARKITPQFVLAHTFAHALIRQLALECGYSSASLRERIYSGTYGTGILIYTATTDADGTLGGLQRQGLARRSTEVFRAAVQAVRWCSSDPLCISGAMMASNDTNLAACHACMLAAETSCEEFNRFLDRALLVGTPENPEIGFFHEWLV